MKKHEPRLTQFLKKTFISSTCIGPAVSSILLLYYSMIWVIVIAIFYYKWEGQEQINFS